MRRCVAAAFGLSLAALPNLPATAASFDCGKAATEGERAICRDPTLSGLDDLLAATLRRSRDIKVVDVSALDRDFLADQRACGADVPCLTATYVGVLQKLKNAGADVTLPADVTALSIAGDHPFPSPRLPATVGACTTTTVTSVAPRLPGSGPSEAASFDNGTSVTFANGGYQVSYLREPAVIAAKPHDPVAMCLVSIPRHCPAGDDRGRFYMVTDMRTHRTWTMPDSQHMCGGA